MMPNKNDIRRAMRSRRQQQTPREHSVAAQRFSRLGQRLLARYKSIAFFIPFDGEPDIAPLQKYLQRNGKRIALPKLARQKHQLMQFAPLGSGVKLQRNRFGIAEPAVQRRWRLNEIEVILLPLTAFDCDGNRLGMGAGFYDRALQSRRGKLLRRPKLIGVAYHWQEIAKLPSDPWDLPLHAILTDKKIIQI